MNATNYKSFIYLLVILLSLHSIAGCSTENKIVNDDGSIYIGELIDGIPHGQGKITYSDGRVVSGEFGNGLLNGQGVSTTPEGGKYEGDYKDGNPHGQGIEIWPNGDKFEGDFQHGVPHGKGLASYPDGTTYSGSWNDGLMNGEMAVKYPNGEETLLLFRNGIQIYSLTATDENGVFQYSYEGEFLGGAPFFHDETKPLSEGNPVVQSVPHGIGKMTLADGSSLDGIFNNGEFIEGIRIFTDGFILEGLFENGILIKGKKTRPDGVIVEGEFKYHEMHFELAHGQAKMIYPDGAVYEGEWVEGQLIYGLYSFNNIIYEGEFSNGSPNGQGTYSFPDGDKYVGEVKDWMFHGKGTYTFLDGRILSGLWENDEYMGN